VVAVVVVAGSNQQRRDIWSRRGTQEGLPLTCVKGFTLTPLHSDSQHYMDRFTITGFIAALLISWLPGGLVAQGRAHHDHTTTQQAAR
jgi:hypothetical protein